jgi:hypothetical protein
MKTRLAAMLFGLLVATQACGANWHRPSELLPGPLNPRQQVQVWRHATPSRWHAVVVSPDTISGIPFLQPITCDSCRVALSRTEVDSLRFGNPVAGLWKSIGLVVGSLLAVCMATCPGHME